MRAQTNFVFIFILVVVLMGIIVLFGYQAISKLTSGAETVALSELQNGLREDSSSIMRLRGTEKVLSYRVPGGINKICFINNSDIGGLNLPTNSDLKGIEAYSGSGEDVFFLENGIVTTALDLGSIKASVSDVNDVLAGYEADSSKNTYLCQKITSKLEIRMVGEGNYVGITTP